MSPCLPKQLAKLLGRLKPEGFLLGLADVFLVGSAEGVLLGLADRVQL
jgi:hypothetical protein